MGNLDRADADRLGMVEAPAYNGDGTDWTLAPPPKGVQEFERGDDRLRVAFHDDILVTWVLLEWAGGPGFIGGKEVSPPHYRIVAFGSGPSSTLREPRHTWFGEDDGYVFYVKPALITWGFQQLKRWFDFDGDE